MGSQFSDKSLARQAFTDASLSLRTVINPRATSTRIVAKRNDCLPFITKRFFYQNQEKKTQ